MEEHRVIQIKTTRTFPLQKFLANLFQSKPPGGLIPVLVGNEESCREVGCKLLSWGESGADNVAGIGVGGE